MHSIECQRPGRQSSYHEEEHSHDADGEKSSKQLSEGDPVIHGALAANTVSQEPKTTMMATARYTVKAAAAAQAQKPSLSDTASGARSMMIDASSSAASALFSRSDAARTSLGSVGEVAPSACKSTQAQHKETMRDVRLRPAAGRMKKGQTRVELSTSYHLLYVPDNRAGGGAVWPDWPASLRWRRGDRERERPSSSSPSCGCVRT